jgi:DNA-binding XRE family transcriptional regulator
MNVKQLREEKNLSQGQLAALIGISQTSLSAIETGKSVPRSTTLGRLKRVLAEEQPIKNTSNIDEVSELRQEIAFLRLQLDKANDHLSKAISLISGKLPRNLMRLVMDQVTSQVTLA